MQHRSEHHDETGTVYGPEEDAVGIQPDHTLPGPQIGRVSPAIEREGAIGFPSQTDVSFEPAAEEDLVEITESLDGQIWTPDVLPGSREPRKQTVNGFISGSRRPALRIVMVKDFSRCLPSVQIRPIVWMSRPLRSLP